MIFNRFKFFFFLISLILIFSCSFNYSDSIEKNVDIKNQFVLFFKILSFDRNFESKYKQSINLGVLFQNKFRRSYLIKEEIKKYLNNTDGLKIIDKELKLFLLDITKTNTLNKQIAENNINLIYLAPLRAINVSKLMDLLKNHKITTFTGEVDYIDKGISICVFRENKNIQFSVNLKSTKAAGMEFSSRLLKLAKIINE